jgi:hypothetical protein
VETMTEIREILRLPAPGLEPLGLAFDGTTLWISCHESHRLYAMDPATWSVRDEVATPGAPVGITVVGDELRAVIGLGDDGDDRYVYRFIPGHGFKSDRIECPDLSGAQLAFDGDTLFLAQAHNMRILALDDRGAVTRTMPLERVPVGIVVVDGCFQIIACDPDFRNPQITKVDARGESLQVEALASIPFGARGLTFDGTRYWTSDRRKNEIVAFTI